MNISVLNTMGYEVETCNSHKKCVCELWKVNENIKKLSTKYIQNMKKKISQEWNKTS